MVDEQLIVLLPAQVAGINIMAGISKLLCDLKGSCFRLIGENDSNTGGQSTATLLLQNIAQILSPTRGYDA
jgi:hypothetical protein